MERIQIKAFSPLIIFVVALAIFAGCAKGGLTSNLNTTPELIDSKQNNLPILDNRSTDLPADGKSTVSEKIPATKDLPPVITPNNKPNNTVTNSNETKSPKKAADNEPITTVPTEIEAKISDLKFTPLVWEKTVKAAPEWSKMIYTIITREETAYLEPNIAQDIEIFCPNYRAINENQRLNFWGQFFAAMSEHESSWIPTSQMTEKSMGKDPVTKKQVASEGLLQLSYQDEKSYRLNCGFDWEKDKLLSQKDPNKTILNPYLNLRCGIKIMMYQLKKYGRITLDKNVYWAVLKRNGKYSKIKQISNTTKSLKFCQ